MTKNKQKAIRTDFAKTSKGVARERSIPSPLNRNVASHCYV